MPYFNVVNRERAEVIGGFTATNAAEIKTGLLVKATGRALTLAGYTDKPDGFAEGLRVHVYAPTTYLLDAGEYASLLTGRLLIRADSNFFYGGTLPAADDTIYAAPSGLMDSTTGGHYSTTKLGKCLKAAMGEDYRTPPNSNIDTVLLDLTVGGIQTV
jgi:hypothetical protein